MKKIYLFLLLAATTASGLFAQGSVEITGVRKREFRGVFPILNKDTRVTEGYYSFHVDEKESAGMINFILSFFSTDMKLVKQTPIVITKRSQVDGSEFNGTDFMLVFNDPIKRKLTYVTVDRSGNIIKQETTVEERMWTTTADLFSAGEDGFLVVKPIKEGRPGYSIACMDSDLSTKWEKQITVDKGYVYPEAVDVGNGRIVIVQSGAPAMISNKIKGELLCLDMSSGSTIYAYPLFDGLNTAMPTSVLVDKNKNVVTSGMYFDGERWNGNESDGIFFLKLDPMGKRVSYITENWKEGIQKQIKSASSSGGPTINARPKVLFHAIVEREDGYQVIGETFKMNFVLVNSSLIDAITGRYIGDITTASGDNGTNQPIVIEVMDFIVFDYDAKGNMTACSIIEKEQTKVTCYYPYNSGSAIKVARLVKQFGFFNFAFMMKGSDGDSQYIVSSNFVKQPNIGFDNITTPGAGHQSIPVTRKTIKGGGIGVMPNVGNNVAIYIFDKKEETVMIYVQPVKI